MPDSEWDWPADGRSTGRNTEAGNLPTSVLGGRAPRNYTQMTVTVTVAAFEVAGDRISRIWAVRNPEKLASWSSRARS